MLIPAPFASPVKSVCPHGRLAIPDLHWTVGVPPLALASMGSFRAMFTVVQNAGHGATLARYLAGKANARELFAGDINALGTAVMADIATVVAGVPPFAAHPLLPHIAVGIHLWGGRMGRAALNLAHGGFFACCPLPAYGDLVQLLLTHPRGMALPGGNWSALMAASAGLSRIGVSFLTKHLSFWSRAAGAPIRLPILDRMVKETFIDPDRPTPVWADYASYVNELEADRAILAARPGLAGITLHDMERQLFNWIKSHARAAWVR